MTLDALVARRNALVTEMYQRCPPGLAPCETAALERVRAAIDDAEHADTHAILERFETLVVDAEALAAKMAEALRIVRDAKGTP